VKYRFILQQSDGPPVTTLCRVMGVSSSAFYGWRNRLATIITAGELQLCRRAEALGLFNKFVCEPRKGNEN